MEMEDALGNKDLQNLTVEELTQRLYLNKELQFYARKKTFHKTTPIPLREEWRQIVLYLKNSLDIKEVNKIERDVEKWYKKKLEGLDDYGQN